VDAVEPDGRPVSDAGEVACYRDCAGHHGEGDDGADDRQRAGRKRSSANVEMSRPSDNDDRGERHTKPCTAAEGKKQRKPDDGEGIEGQHACDPGLPRDQLVARERAKKGKKRSERVLLAKGAEGRRLSALSQRIGDGLDDRKHGNEVPAGEQYAQQRARVAGALQRLYREPEHRGVGQDREQAVVARVDAEHGCVLVFGEEGGQSCRRHECEPGQVQGGPLEHKSSGADCARYIKDEQSQHENLGDQQVGQYIVVVRVPPE
jgi:hypothetical protein